MDTRPVLVLLLGTQVPFSRSLVLGLGSIEARPEILVPMSGFLVACVQVTSAQIVYVYFGKPNQISFANNKKYFMIIF